MSTEEKKEKGTPPSTPNPPPPTPNPPPSTPVLKMTTLEEIKKHGLRPQKGSLPDLARRGLWPKPISVPKKPVPIHWSPRSPRSLSPLYPRSPSPEDTYDKWWESEMDKACDAWWEARMKGIEYPPPWVELPAHLKPGYVSPLPDYRDRGYYSDSDDEYFQQLSQE